MLTPARQGCDWQQFQHRWLCNLGCKGSYKPGYSNMPGMYCIWLHLIYIYICIHIYLLCIYIYIYLYYICMCFLNRCFWNPFWIYKVLLSMCSHLFIRAVHHLFSSHRWARGGVGRWGGTEKMTWQFYAPIRTVFWCVLDTQTSSDFPFQYNWPWYASVFVYIHMMHNW